VGRSGCSSLTGVLTIHPKAGVIYIPSINRQPKSPEKCSCENHSISDLFFIFQMNPTRVVCKLISSSLFVRFYRFPCFLVFFAWLLLHAPHRFISNFFIYSFMLWFCCGVRKDQKQTGEQCEEI